MPSDTVRISFDDVMAGVQLLGLVGFIDPPRLEAKEAIAECRSAGIDVKMITGDHAATALAIARQLDLADDPQVMTGLDVEKLRSEEHTYELQSLMRITYAVFCLKKKNKQT